jgi:uncharacterized protein (TIGR03437 family)
VKNEPKNKPKNEATDMKQFSTYFLCVAFTLFLMIGIAAAQQAPVPLGTANTYGVLAGTTITNTGATTINGNLGLYPGTSVTGSPIVIGTSNVNNAAAITAKSDLRAAFLNAAGRTGPTLVAGGALGGRILTPGLYKDDGAPASLGLTGTLTLDFQGDPSAVFIFQSASTLITGAGSNVVLINNAGGTGCGVFWQVGSAATIGTSTAFVGTILANDDISVAAGATVAGGLLAGGQASGAGAITLNNNTITAGCASVATPPDLTIAKTHTGDFIWGQAGAAYTISVNNIGSSSTTGVVTMTDTLPVGLTAMAIGGTGWSCVLGTLTCTRSDALAPGLSYPAITLTVNVAVNAPASVTNTALVSGGGEVNTSNNMASDLTTMTIPAQLAVPDLTIRKMHAGSFRQGDTGDTYVLMVFNYGTASTNGVVTVHDTLPVSLTATGIAGTGWSCVLGTLTCTRSDVLAPGLSYPAITLTVNVAVNAPAAVTNTASVSGGGEINTLNDTASDVTVIRQTAVPDLTIVKSHAGNFRQGDPADTYTLTVANAGQAATTGAVTVSDTLPAGLTATAISGTGWSCTLAALTCTRSDALAAGASYPVITLTVSVANSGIAFNPVTGGPAFQAGDILLSMTDGTVQWRRRDWSLVRVLTSTTDGQAKGMAFDSSGNLFVTHWYGTGSSGNDIMRFDRNGNSVGLFGSGFDCNPSSIVFDNSGNAYIGQADCSAQIFKFDSSGNRLAQYTAAVEQRGSSYMVLDPNQCTMYYTSEGPNVKRFDVCSNTQMSDFNSAPLPDPIGGAQAFSLLPGGGMLIADFNVIARLDPSGNFVRTYDAPANDCWLGMALDPDGTSFWASNWCGSSVTRFDLATGNVLESHVVDNRGFMVKQIAIPGNIFGIGVTNTAAVAGGGEVNTSNDSASDATTIDPPAPPASNPVGIVNAASYMHTVSAGSIASVFGNNLSSGQEIARIIPLPTTLASASFQIGDRVVPLFFASPNQVNMQVPWELAGRPQAMVTATVGATISSRQMVSLAPVAPGLFTLNEAGSSQGAVIIGGTQLIAAPPGVGGRRPVTAGEFISIYSTGLGAVSNQPATGIAASADPPSVTTTTPTVTIGGISAPVTFSGLAPGGVGLYQVNVKVPVGAPAGDAVPLILSIGGATSNTVTIAVR